MADEEGDEYPAIVLDVGTGQMKCGYAGEDMPRAVFPSIVGRRLRVGDGVSGGGGEGEGAGAGAGEGGDESLGAVDDDDVGDGSEVFVGQEAQDRRDELVLKYPVGHGIVEDWDDMERLIGHAFHSALEVDPMDYNTLMTEPPLNPKKNRERLTELMFETFRVPGLYIHVQAVLSLYSVGKTTGLVFDSGAGVSHTVPVFEGYSLPHAVQRLDFAGREVTHKLTRLLTERGHYFDTSGKEDVVRDMKENLAYVARDYDEEMRLCEANPADYEKTYVLPDKTELVVGSERFRCAEVLFTPMEMGKESAGIDEAVFNTVQKCDLDLRANMLGNIVLSGGTTMLPGLAERLENGVVERAASAARVRVTAPSTRKYSVWCGGAVLADLGTFQHQWITSDEYEEHGPSIVHRKCVA